MCAGLTCWGLGLGAGTHGRLGLTRALLPPPPWPWPCCVQAMGRAASLYWNVSGGTACYDRDSVRENALQTGSAYMYQCCSECVRGVPPAGGSRGVSANGRTKLAGSAEGHLLARAPSGALALAGPSTVPSRRAAMTAPAQVGPQRNLLPFQRLLHVLGRGAPACSLACSLACTVGWEAGSAAAAPRRCWWAGAVAGSWHQSALRCIPRRAHAHHPRRPLTARRRARPTCSLRRWMRPASRSMGPLAPPQTLMPCPGCMEWTLGPAAASSSGTACSTAGPPVGASGWLG